MNEIEKKIRRYEIRIRKAIKSHLQGDFHSVFKGSGLEFDDVRAYQYGDDVRTIDWNVTAKGHGTFIKTFREEKEQTIYFLLDVSASQEIGVHGKQKIDIAKEICCVLALSAIHEGSEAGVICFSDQKELLVKPNKGPKHGYEIIRRLYNFTTKSRQTDLNFGFKYALGWIKKRGVVIVISDFIDDNYEHNLKALARKHDVVVINISDKRETNLPGLGIVPLLDKESGKTVWVNTSSDSFKKTMGQNYASKHESLAQFCRKIQANYLEIFTDEDYVARLIKLFKTRNQSKKSGF